MHKTRGHRRRLVLYAAIWWALGAGVVAFQLIDDTMPGMCCTIAGVLMGLVGVCMILYPRFRVWLQSQHYAGRAGVDLEDLLDADFDFVRDGCLQRAHLSRSEMAFSGWVDEPTLFLKEYAERVALIPARVAIGNEVQARVYFVAAFREDYWRPTGFIAGSREYAVKELRPLLEAVGVASEDAEGRGRR